MKDKLLEGITELIEANKAELNCELEDNDVEYLQTRLYTFVHQSIPKYMKGKMEHQTNLPTMSEEMKAEMRAEEIIDLMFYN